MACMPCSLLAKSEAEELLKGNWYKASTPHFTIITDSSKRNALRLVENLEKFRSVFYLFSGVEPPEKFRTIKLIATRKKKKYQTLAVTQSLKKTGGFFIDSINGNYSLVSLGRSDSLSTLFHEYTHYLHANMRIENAPMWFSEGVAGHLSSMEFKGRNEIQYGKPLRGYWRYLQSAKWLPIEEVLSTKNLSLDDERRVQKFYAQSWLMVHYFFSKKTSSGSIEEYLRLVAEGTAVAVAVEQAFGMSIETLTKELRAYGVNGKLKYSKIFLNSPAVIVDLAVEKMSVDQAAFELGEFLLHGQSSTELARNLFELSLAKNESNVGSLAGLAKISLLEDFDRADELIEMAKKISPTNPWVAIVSGQINSRKRGAAVDGSEKQEYWNRAINDYNLAIKGEDTILQALDSVAGMYASKKNWTKYDQVVGAALELAPSNQSVRYMAIIANIKNGRRDSAEFIANLIRVNSHLSSKSLSSFESWYEMQLL